MRLAVLLASSLALVSAAAADEPLPIRARQVLQKYCYRCHGENGTVEGGVNYVLARQQLVARKKVVPGDPAKSRLLQRVADGEMPPEGEKSPSKEEVEVLRRWIAAGAADLHPVGRRDFITSKTLLDTLAADLSKVPERARPFTRYFTLTHLHNAGVSNDELETYRQGLSKLLNSLSWARAVVAPSPVDAARTVYRIDLRHYKWGMPQWDALVKAYPYGALWDTETDRDLQRATRSAMPYLRGDWFVANASQPPLYHDLLELPASASALEASLRIDVEANHRTGQFLRAGFNGSGVSRNNRLIERHESLWGAYWKSYDFAAATGRQSLFSSPLGPGSQVHHFKHDGGEIIFALPNGLLAYLLVDASGRRIDRGPLDVVSDPRRPDRTVVNGLSCMSCHARGIIPKEDQVREYAVKNRRFLSVADYDEVLAAYPPKDRSLAAMKADADAFLKAVEKTGHRPGRTEPVAALALHHEADLDAGRAAAELHLTPADFRSRLEKAPVTARALASLAADGTVARAAFEAAYPSALRELKIGRPLPASVDVARRLHSAPWRGPDRPWPGTPGSGTTPPRPRLGNSVLGWGRDNHRYFQFNNLSSQQAHAVATSPRERRYAAETLPGIINLFDDRDTSQCVYFHGHEAAVYALDVSRDEQLLASGSLDQTARLWETATGKELFRLSPHPGPVYAVRFSPDGRWVATGSDRVRLWDVKTGKLLRTFPESGAVKALAFDPDGKTLISAGEKVIVWAPEAGKEVAVLSKHKGGVLAIAISPDGKLLATGGEDKSVVVWDLKARKPVATLAGHAQAVTALLFNRKSDVLVSGSGGVRGGDLGKEAGEVRVWDVAAAKEIGRFTEHTRGVSGLALSADGRQALSSGYDQGVRMWQLPAVRPEPFEGHRGGVSAFQRSADGKFILTGGQDRTARWWDADTGKLIHTLAKHTHVVHAVAISPDNQFGWTAGDRTVRRWDLSTGKEVRCWVLPANAGHLAVSRDGGTVVVGLYDRVVVLDPATDRARSLEVKGYWGLTLSPDGKQVACPRQKDTLLFDIATGKETGRLLDVTGPVVAYAPDGKHLALAFDTQLRLVDLEGKVVRRFEGHTQQIKGIAFNRDGTRLLSCSGKRILEPEVRGRTTPRRYLPHDCGYRLWDTTTGKEVGSRDGLPFPVQFVAFARDERQAFALWHDSFIDRIERRPLEVKGAAGGDK